MNTDFAAFQAAYTRAAKKLFDDFVLERGLDIDEGSWSEKDEADFAALANKLDTEWAEKQRGWNRARGITY